MLNMIKFWQGLYLCWQQYAQHYVSFNSFNNPFCSYCRYINAFMTKSHGSKVHLRQHFCSTAILFCCDFWGLYWTVLWVFIRNISLNWCQLVLTLLHSASSFFITLLNVHSQEPGWVFVNHNEVCFVLYAKQSSL